MRRRKWLGISQSLEFWSLTKAIRSQRIIVKGWLVNGGRPPAAQVSRLWGAYEIGQRGSGKTRHAPLWRESNRHTLASGVAELAVRKSWSEFRDHKFLKNISDGIETDPDQAVFKRCSPCVAVLPWQVEVGDASCGEVSDDG